MPTQDRKLCLSTCLKRRSWMATVSTKTCPTYNNVLCLLLLFSVLLCSSLFLRLWNYCLWLVVHCGFPQCNKRQGRLRGWRKTGKESQRGKKKKKQESWDLHSSTYLIKNTLHPFCFNATQQATRCCKHLQSTVSKQAISRAMQWLPSPKSMQLHFKSLLSWIQWGAQKKTKE